MKRPVAFGMAFRIARFARSSSLSLRHNRVSQVPFNAQLLSGLRYASTSGDAAESNIPVLERTNGKLVLKYGLQPQNQAPLEVPVPEVWLRDNCRCDKCMNMATMQKRFNVLKDKLDCDVEEMTSNEEGVEVLWSDKHRSKYSWSWMLAAMLNPDKKPALYRPYVSKTETWRGYNFKEDSRVPDVSFDSVMKAPDSAMGQLMQHIRRYGFCFVSSTPATPEATQELLERIGPIRNTHYGGFYDFIPDLSSKDTAYTNEALDPHTDTTYFSEPAGLQAFHLLSHTPPPDKAEASGGIGGESILVDGYRSAMTLAFENLNHFRSLNIIKLPWHASGNEGVSISPDCNYPVIEGDRDRIFRIRWNNDDRGVLHLRGPNTKRWYDAARHWYDILNREQNQYRFQLVPGRVLIFDNWRILHGRTAFEGMRRICGGYISRDDFISRWKTSNFSPEEVLKGTLNQEDDQYRSPVWVNLGGRKNSNKGKGGKE